MTPYDVAVIPPWYRYKIRNLGKRDAIVFSFSDEPVFRSIGAFREKLE
ncbi:MAG: hypothetical protein QXV69_09610 [Sulfolobaceae archaeon]